MVIEPTTLEKVREVIMEECGISAQEIMPDTPIISLVKDSLEAASLILNLEDALKIEISEDDVWRSCSVQDVVNYVDSK